MTKALDELLTLNDDINESDFADTDQDILSMITRSNSTSDMRGQCRSQPMIKLFISASVTSIRHSEYDVLRSEVWHCMSGIMEGGVKYVKSPGDIYR